MNHICLIILRWSLLLSNANQEKEVSPALEVGAEVFEERVEVLD